MALPSSGVMKASMIQSELGESGSWSINSQSSRNLAKVPSGTIKFSDFYGKSNSYELVDKLIYSYSMPSVYPSSHATVVDKILDLPFHIIQGTIKCTIDTQRHNRGSNPGCDPCYVNLFGVRVGEGYSRSNHRGNSNIKSTTVNEIGHSGQILLNAGRCEGTGFRMGVSVYFTGTARDILYISRIRILQLVYLLREVI